MSDVTPHPIDTEALLDRLRRNAQEPMDRVERLNGMGGSPEYGDDERPFPDEMLKLLDLLAAAEHRATRAEAQAEARRVNILYWQERAGATQASARTLARESEEAQDRAREAEARIKAWAQQYDYDMRLESDRADTAEAQIRAVRELHQQSALIRYVPRSMRDGHDDDQPFHYCTGCDGARYPCDTIRALDATTTQENR